MVQRSRPLYECQLREQCTFSAQAGKFLSNYFTNNTTLLNADSGEHEIINLLAFETGLFCRSKRCFLNATTEQEKGFVKL